jgi:hypothetical protein
VAHFEYVYDSPHHGPVGSLTPVNLRRINSAVFVLLLGWLFVPYYLSSKVFTMPGIALFFLHMCAAYLDLADLLPITF